jgi:hypothetical protein
MGTHCCEVGAIRNGSLGNAHYSSSPSKTRRAAMGFSFHSTGSVERAQECWNESHTINGSPRAAKTKEEPADVNRRALGTCPRTLCTQAGEMIAGLDPVMRTGREASGPVHRRRIQSGGSGPPIRHSRFPRLPPSTQNPLYK